MKVDAKYRPEKCCSRDETRPNLTNPYFDAEEKLLVATDGHALVAVPVEDGGETSGYVSGAALRAGRRRVKCPPPVEVAVGPKDGTFPAWRQVVPKVKAGDEGTFTVRLDAKLLADLAEALGDSRVELTISAQTKGSRAGRYYDGFGPILVRRAFDPADEREVGLLAVLGEKR